MATDYAALKKGGWMRQKQKNRFALRVHVVGGHLTDEQMKVISEVAKKYGEGYVHLTARQSLEIPWIRLEDIEEVKEALAKGGVTPSVCGPRVRTTTACQGNRTCPSACIDTYALAQEIDARYFARELPGKFKFGVTGCRNNCLKTEEKRLRNQGRGEGDMEAGDLHRLRRLRQGMPGRRDYAEGRKDLDRFREMHVLRTL